uniref:Ion channel n=1 Tax=Heterorhabditis bacteriophora TaxID=37862 RepID=A0A1I7XKC7_HETBA
MNNTESRGEDDSSSLAKRSPRFQSTKVMAFEVKFIFLHFYLSLEIREDNEDTLSSTDSRNLTTANKSVLPDLNISGDQMELKSQVETVSNGPERTNRIRPILEKHQSFEQTNGNNKENNDKNYSAEQDAIDKYYQRNQATINSLQSRHHETVRRAPERRHPPSLASVSQRSVGSHRSVIMPSPKVTERKNFRKSFYWLAHNHKKIGFRHICMLLLVLLYTLLGATMFYLIESNYEKNTVVIRKIALDETILRIAKEMTEKVNDPDQLVNVTTMEDYIKLAYVTLLQQESAYKGSTFYKAADPANNYKWTFGSAFFFSMNVFTTTGYGSIAPESVAGKSCVIWYGLIFVPLTLVVIRDLGQWTLVHMTKIYARLLIKFRTARGHSETKEDELIELPLKLSAVIMVSYLMFTSLFVYEYDALSGPPDTGMDFFHAFYFSFISMSTIGLGDIMPNNVTFAPIITIMFFFGMPILKVVNRVTYITVENGVFGLFEFTTQAVSPRPSLRSRSISNRYDVDEESSSEEVNIFICFSLYIPQIKSNIH